MKTLNFKTNIITNNRVEVITLGLNNVEQIDGWNVNPDVHDKLLTVQTTDNHITDLVRRTVEKAGYQATNMD